MTSFSSYAEPADGFVVAAGRKHGLHRLVLAADDRMAEIVDRAPPLP